MVPLRQDASRGLVRRPDVTLPPPGPSSMVEDLLHPYLGMALWSSQQGSTTSFQDHDDKVYSTDQRGIFFFLFYSLLIIISEVRRVLRRKTPWI